MKSQVKFSIYEVCCTLSLQQLKSLGFFNLNDEKLSTKYNICLERIIDRTIYDDKTASASLGYTNHNSFLRFKHRFTERIKSYIFLVDLHKSKKREDETIQKEIWRELAVAQILMKSDNIASARALMIKVYESAKEYEFIEIMIAAIPSLRQLFAFVTPNKKQYEYYKSEDRFLRKQYMKYALSREYYDEVSHLDVFTDLRSKVDISKVCESYYQELSSQFEEGDFLAFRSNAYQIAAYGLQQAKKLQEAQEINFTSLAFLNTKSKFSAIQKYKILKDILSTHLQMKNYEKSLSTVKELEDMGLSYNFNYFSLQALKFQVFALQGKYNELYTLTQFILSRKELKKHLLRNEQWKIKEAFTHFLVAVGKIDASLLEQNPLKKFKPKKFVNEIELHSKNKRGANIAIHIVQLLFFLIDKKYGEVLDRLDALNQYTHRYLRNDETLRSNCFIKMLLKLPEANYNPIRTKRYVSKYWKKLQENPLEVTLQSSEVEIIPYEQLWEFVIEIISKDK